LPLIRRGLSELGLDWDAPPLPEAKAPPPGPLEVRIDLGHLAEPDATLRKLRIAVERNPKDGRPTSAVAHFCLGNVLLWQGKLTEAEAAYKEAIRLQDDYAEAHCNLGDALRLQGRFSESLESVLRGHDIGHKRPNWNHPSLRWLRNAERNVALEKKLTAILAGEAKPSGSDERIALAQVAALKSLHWTAARLYAEGFSDKPALAEDPRIGHRYGAAVAAVRAAFGEGKEAEKPSEKDRVELRRRALEWLRADLGTWEKAAKSDPSARTNLGLALRQWQQNAALAPVRDKEALAKLLEAERTAWQKLWADVAEVLKQVQENPGKQ
jgi:tetratricopeptide (TPR) repeat protein